MEEPQFDTQGMLSRASELVQDIRATDIYPALVGGIAGGIAGGLVAALIAGRGSYARRQVDEDGDEIEKKSGRSWNVRELVQLATIAASLVKQAQAWYQERSQEQESQI